MIIIPSFTNYQCLKSWYNRCNAEKCLDFDSPDVELFL